MDFDWIFKFVFNTAHFFQSKLCNCKRSRIKILIISQSVSMKCNFYFFYHWRNMSNISTILNNHLTNSQSAHESDVSLHWPKEQLSSSLGELRLHAFQSILHQPKEQLSGRTENAWTLDSPLHWSGFSFKSASLWAVFFANRHVLE